MLTSVLVLALVFPAAATWVWFVALAGQPAMRPVYALAKLLQFSLPALWVLGVERRRRGPARTGAERIGHGGDRVMSGQVPLGSGGDPLAGLSESHLGRREDPIRPVEDPVRSGGRAGKKAGGPGGSEVRPRAPAGRGIGLGLAFGALVFLGILALYFGALKSSLLIAGAPAGVHAKVAQLGLLTPLRFLGLALFYSLIHSLLEEYYWRWFVFGNLRELVPVWGAVPIASLAFMAHHVIVLRSYLPWGLTLLISAAVALGGAVWAWLYHRTGSLYGPWLSHLLVDAAIMVVGYDMIWG